MANNHERFESLHQEYHLMVYQMCKGFMHGQEDLAQDLTQETFINIWRSLEKFRGSSSYKTWIYRITVNTCLKYIRSDKSRHQTALSDHHSVTAEEASIRTRESPYQALYQAIGQLKELDRLIIMMVLDELQYSEIAEVMGMSEGNLRVKIHRIKKELKKILNHD